MKWDLDAILKVMDAFDKSDMTKFQYEDEEVTLKLASEKAPVISAPAGVMPVAAPAVAVSNTETVKKEKAEKEGTVVKSPLVGTFYASKAEGEAPYVSVGDTVKKGQVIGIVEAMKLMNEIEAETDGVVAEIFVENEQLVEYGQPLIRLI